MTLNNMEQTSEPITKKRIVATGTFDILHPGHIHFLSESKKLGDELWVIVSRKRNVRHKPAPVVSEEQRLMMIKSLKCVDHAILGDEVDMFKPIREIAPSIITLGFNQYFDEDKLRNQLSERGISSEVVRIGAYTASQFTSSTQIIDEAVRRRQEIANAEEKNAGEKNAGEKNDGEK